MSRSKKILFSLISTSFLVSACGSDFETSQAKIVGGSLVAPNSTGPERISTVGLSGCTGTIIANDLILTAAHCFNNAINSGYVVFGTSFSSSNRQIVRIASGIVNPQYRSTSDSHIDIAVLKLASSIPSGYKPIRLLPSNSPLQAGDAVRLAGYGSNNQPNSFGTLRTVDSRYVGQAGNGALYIKNGATAACSGDSGGPLYTVKNNQWYLAGVTSTAIMNANYQCIGGNYYSSTISNYSLILSMARQLTGRQNPLP